MMKLEATIAFVFGTFFADAATRIVVLELGNKGTIHRTNAATVTTSVDGMLGFWNCIHGNSRKLQRAGLNVVPDLFQKPDGGHVIGVSGSSLDLTSMPFLSSLVSGDNSDVIGVMEVNGSQHNTLLANIAEYKDASPADALKQKYVQKGLFGTKVVVDGNQQIAADSDRKISIMLEELQLACKTEGKTIVVHVVIDEDISASSHRRLDEAADGQAAEANGDDDKNYNGYYGHGYYNEYNEYVTQFKSMFQIQYFNVVLWTAIGLAVVLIFTIYLMVNMPLEADTLLFGESAKLVGED